MTAPTPTLLCSYCLRPIPPDVDQADLPYPAYGPADNHLCSIFNACRRVTFEAEA